jgi:eukaryotic-like serine/threonine-protein kinase
VTTGVSAQDPVLGQTLGHYRIVEKIGSGGMGVVYRAHDEHLDREVAIKVLPPGTLPDETTRRRFRNEALALSRLNHPNVAIIHDFDTEQGTDFLVMEYIAGISLNEKLAESSLPEKQVIALGTQLAEGLCAAHEHSIVHRDLKPGNLRITDEGWLKILDFGLAKLRASAAAPSASETLTESGVIAGTLPYMAPEQVLGGEIDARTDIHAAGAVLYEMATGRRPFATEDPSTAISAILRSSPPPLAALNPRSSPELQRIVAKCLEREKEHRYQSARELAVDLRRLARENESVHDSREIRSTSRRAALAVRKLKPAVVASAVAILLLILALVFPAGLHKILKNTTRPASLAASVAVLPFTDLSPNHDHQYFCIGLAEEILNQLTKIPNLKVAARNSAFQFSGQNVDPKALGQTLNVSDVLEGSVQTDGVRVRITVRLSKTDTSLSVWSQSYDRNLGDVFAVEDEIAAAIAGALQPALLGNEPAKVLSPSRTTNSAAYQAFLQARFLSRTYDPEAERKAFEFVDRAIALDPDYAPAYALRGVMTAESGLMGNRNVAEALETSRRDARKAIALDPNLAAGYLALSESQAMGEWDWQGAEQSVRKARELAPGDADALLQDGFLKLCRGRLDEAAELMRQGLGLDPLAASKHLQLAQLLRDAGRYEAAHKSLESALELNPHQVWTHETRGEVYLAQRNPEKALSEMELEPGEAWHVFGMALAYHATGKHQESDAALASLTAKHSKIAAFQIAQVHAYRGESEQAIEWLNRALQQGDGGMSQLKVNWMLKNLRGDPRYSELLAKVNLSE